VIYFFWTSFAVVVIALLGTRYIKGGVHAICWVVFYSYVTALLMTYFLNVPQELYFKWECARLAVISIILLILSEKSHHSSHYRWYVILIFAQVAVSSFAILNMVGYEVLVCLCVTMALLELGIFFNGIHRSVKEDNRGMPGYNIYIRTDNNMSIDLPGSCCQGLDKGPSR